MGYRVTETFFQPDEISREDWALPADIYNMTRTLLARSEYDCTFVPIRSMQYLAVITAGEIVFVDSQAYACRNGEGGRLITLAWKFDSRRQRDALDEPHACHVVHYHRDSDTVQQRLVRDFRDALALMDQRYRDTAMPPSGARILPLKQTAS